MNIKYLQNFARARALAICIFRAGVNLLKSRMLADDLFKELRVIRFQFLLFKFICKLFL